MAKARRYGEAQRKAVLKALVDTVAENESDTGRDFYMSRHIGAQLPSDLKGSMFPEDVERCLDSFTGSGVTREHCFVLKIYLDDQAGFRPNNSKRADISKYLGQ